MSYENLCPLSVHGYAAGALIRKRLFFTQKNKSIICGCAAQGCPQVLTLGLNPESFPSGRTKNVIVVNKKNKKR